MDSNSLERYSDASVQVADGMRKLSIFSAVDSGYGSLPKQRKHTAGEMLLLSLCGQTASTVKELVPKILDRFSPFSESDLDMQALAEVISDDGIHVNAFGFDERVLSEFNHLTYTYLDSHIEVTLTRFLYELKTNDVADYLRAGSRYYNGTRVKRNYDQAVFWYRKAVANVSSPWAPEAAKALKCLGMCHLLGHGVPQDPKQAFCHFSEAAKYGDQDSALQLLLCYQNGLGVPQDEKHALELLKESAQTGHAPALYLLGRWYHEGRCGLPKDDTMAINLFQNAASQDNLDAQYDLACFYQCGQGSTKDPALAFKWFSRSASLGNVRAQNQLGLCYQSGFGTRIDKTAAFMWFQKSASQGCTLAKFNLGMCYMVGDGTLVDYALAVDNLFEAANENHALALKNLGHCFQNGIGVPVDAEKAKALYAKAVYYSAK